MPLKVASYFIRRRELYFNYVPVKLREVVFSHTALTAPSFRATPAGAGKGKNRRTKLYLVFQVAKLVRDVRRVEELPAVVG